MDPYKNIGKRPSETGSALVYILIAIALLAALTASFMKPASQQTTAQESYNSFNELRSQVEFINSSILECILMYPDGDAALAGSDNFGYPINPSSIYLTGPSADDRVQFVRCPGNPGGTADHANIFSGDASKYLPPPPNLFNEWYYYSGIDGVFFYNSTDKTDGFLQTAVQKLDENYAECQTDIVDASAGDVELTSTAGVGDPKCLDGNTCFRVWMRTSGTSTYQAGSVEAIAGCP